MESGKKRLKKTVLDTIFRKKSIELTMIFINFIFCTKTIVIFVVQNFTESWNIELKKIR